MPINVVQFSERFRQACAAALTLRRLRLLPKASPSFRVFCAAALGKVRAHYEASRRPLPTITFHRPRQLLGACNLGYRQPILKLIHRP